jgi:hypothetical protein
MQDINFKGTKWGGSQAKVFFDNGFGASIITGGIAYSSLGSPYELAVLEGTEEDASITYDTSIASDVLGHLNKDEVYALLERIENL